MWSEEGARAATCEETARADLRTRVVDLLGAKLQPANRYAIDIAQKGGTRFITNSSSGRSLRSARRFGNELRASAAGRLRPADLCEVDSSYKTCPQPSGGPAFEQREDAALRPGTAAGCGGSGKEPPIQNSKFNIQNSELPNRAAACGGRTRLQGAAGLRRPQAAARRLQRNRVYPDRPL